MDMRLESECQQPADGAGEIVERRVSVQSVRQREWCRSDEMFVVGSVNIEWMTQRPKVLDAERCPDTLAPWPEDAVAPYVATPETLRGKPHSCSEDVSRLIQ